MNPGLPLPQPALYSDHSLVAFLGSIVQGRRVGIVGPASGDVAKRARALGANTVVAFGGTGDGVAIRPLSKGAIEAFQGRLDVLVIPDAAAVPFDQVLDEARKTLGQDGVVVVGSRPPGAAAPLEATRTGDGPDYVALEQELAQRFDHVTMVGRGPFVGYLYARIDADDAAVTLDTRLVPDEAASAEAFIAVAGDRAIDVDSLALVQIPPADVLASRTSVVDTSALEEEVAKREAKIKDLEKSAAERWVQLQKLENDLRTSEEEGRRARERAVRLAKDLDDEQKRRQRSEIEGQMQRRASEMPSPSAEELRVARERLTVLERDLDAARKETSAAEKRLADVGRELDESQAAEGELRRQLDVAESRKPAVTAEDHSAEFARLENELRARAEQVNRLEAQIRERDAAVRELAFSLESLQTRDLAAELLAAKERVAELSSLNTGLASEANSLLEQQDALRERVVQLEAEIAAKGAEIDAMRRAPSVTPSTPTDDTRSEQLAMAELRLREQTDALRAAEDRAVAAERRAEESLAALQQASKQHDDEKVRAGELLRQLTETRNELSTQYAMVVSMEDRVNQVSLELEGTKAGYVRRVRELEREVEGLLQALEVVGAHSSDEDEKVDTLIREIDLMRAERTGIQLRLRDAEAALVAQRQRAVATPRVSEAPPAHATGAMAEVGEEMRNEQLLADLAETAARLASTEESLVATREAAIAAEQRAEEMRIALEDARAEMRATATAGTIRPGDDDETMRREAAERELLVRSLVAQLEDRDLRLRALERRLVEEVERARRTESEIWEVELRARDQRIQSLTREVERARTEGHAGTNGDTDLTALRNALEGRERELLALKTSIETVRTGLSNILVDGRGAVIAHDLVTILRQIEE
jgi:chromosome segregation ATPase